MSDKITGFHQAGPHEPSAALEGHAGDVVLVWDDQADIVPEGHVAIVTLDANDDQAVAIFSLAEVGFLGYALSRLVHSKEV